MDLVNFPHELLEIVDENDEVIGAATRALTHRTPGLLHREVDVIVHDQAGRVLFQQRSRNKHQKPLAWTFGAGGHVPAGIEPHDAAEVELREELGLAGEVRFLHKLFVAETNNYRFAYFFEYVYNGEPITFEPKEIEQIRFVGPDEFTPDMFAPQELNPKAIEVVELFWSGKLQH